MEVQYGIISVEIRFYLKPNAFFYLILNKN